MAFTWKEKSNLEGGESDIGKSVELLFERWIWLYVLLSRKVQRRLVLQNL